MTREEQLAKLKEEMGKEDVRAVDVTNVDEVKAMLERRPDLWNQLPEGHKKALLKDRSFLLSYVAGSMYHPKRDKECFPKNMDNDVDMLMELRDSKVCAPDAVSIYVRTMDLSKFDVYQACTDVCKSNVLAAADLNYGSKKAVEEYQQDYQTILKNMSAQRKYQLEQNKHSGFTIV